MPTYLVSVDDGQGRRFLAKREDGKGLLTNEGCEDCCNPGGECQTIRRYNRCPSYPAIEGCQSAPDHLWLCEVVDPPMPMTFKEGNSCYSRTDTLIPTVEIPVGDILIVGTPPDRPLGCNDPACTECQQFYLADPCPGQNVSGLPHVYVRVEIVPMAGPGQDCAGVSIDWPDRGRICYTVKPGTMYNRPHVDATGGIIHPAYTPLPPDFKCCICVVGCNETPVFEYSDCGLGQRTINLRCCCSEEWSATVTLTAIFTFDPGPGGVIQTDTLSGTVRQGNPVVFPVQTFTRRVYRPPSGSDPGYDSGPQPVTPPDVNHCPPALLGAIGNNDSFPWYQWLAQNANMTHCPAGGPFVVTEPGGNVSEVVRADTFLTCNTFSLNYLWRQWVAEQPGSPREQVSITLSVQVRHTGRCGGGCGQASGQVQDASGAIVARQRAKAESVRAVPREQWPEWASKLALLATDNDKGVGDTFARTTGPIGGNLFKAGMAAIGRECGCAFRQAEWNAMYPYSR